MPTTITAAFEEFFSNINLPGDHRSTANSRKDHLVSLLGQQFNILEYINIGSISKFTALKNKSDVDIMIVLHYKKHIKDKLPSQVLMDVRTALAEYKTNVRRNGQAVTLNYTSWPNVDIVPAAKCIDDNDNFTHYEIPDSNNETWIPTNPKTIASDIEEKSQSEGEQFRKIIKMIKHWNSVHSNYLQSYHIEVLAVKALSCANTSIDWNIYNFFETARELVANPVYYDVGFADNYLTATDRQEILKRLQTASSNSLIAWGHAAIHNNYEEAIKIWRQIFGDKFPNFGN